MKQNISNEDIGTNNHYYRPKVDLLNDFDQEKVNVKFEPRSPKKSKKGKILFFTVIFIIFFLISFFSPAIISTKNILKNFSSGNFLGIWETVVKLISAKDKLLKGEGEDRINILVLGIGGRGHQGPYLSDTIILASIKPSEKKISTISIPRDLYAPIPGYSWKKINNAYALGEINNEKGGELISKVVENIFEIPIHYYVVCDFSGFKEMIDSVGGINIYVERSFTDNQYPTSDFKVQFISFKKGQQEMSGGQALKFVRSRHGDNNEGSDFARSRRQQKVILALKDKIFSFNTFLNPSKTSDLLDSLNESIKTNLKLQEIIRLANLTKNFNNDKIVTKVLENNKGPLYSDITINGAYILKPKAGSFKELAFIAKNIFNEFVDPVDKNENNQKPKIVVQNGTTYPGLAFNTAQNLKFLNFETLQIGNADEQNYKKTIIYDLSQGEKKESLDILKERLEAEIYEYLPDFLNNELESDFLIILGENSIPASANN